VSTPETTMHPGDEIKLVNIAEILKSLGATPGRMSERNVAISKKLRESAVRPRLRP
jgi:hypothetical protein